MIIRLAKIEDEEKISRLIAQFRVELKQFKGIKSTPKIDQAKEEFKEYIEGHYKMIRFLFKMGYDVLNLIEIRKLLKDEILTKKICVGNHDYNY